MVTAMADPKGAGAELVKVWPLRLTVKLASGVPGMANSVPRYSIPADRSSVMKLPSALMPSRRFVPASVSPPVTGVPRRPKSGDRSVPPCAYPIAHRRPATCGLVIGWAVAIDPLPSRSIVTFRVTTRSYGVPAVAPTSRT